MPGHAEEIEAIKRIFVDLSVPHRSALSIAGKLCGIAARKDQFECFLDSNEMLHVHVNGKEAFQCDVEGGKGNFRNLLAAMWTFAKQFADETKTVKLSPYGLDCVINPPKDATDGAVAVHLKTVNNGSEQRFCFSKM